MPALFILFFCVDMTFNCKWFPCPTCPRSRRWGPSVDLRRSRSLVLLRVCWATALSKLPGQDLYASTMTKWSSARLYHQGEDGESFLGVSWFPQMWLGWDRKRLVLEIRWWNHPFENCNLAKSDHCHPRRWRYVVLGLALLSRARPSVGGRRRLWFNRLPIIIIMITVL